MDISQKLLYRISLVYIYIPIFLIVIGWCRPMFALFATLLNDTFFILFKRNRQI